MDDDRRPERARPLGHPAEQQAERDGQWHERARWSLVLHRDVGQTECPGDLAYNQLAAIRSAVAGIGNPKLFSPGAAPDTVSGDQVTGYAKTTISAGGSGTATWSVTISHFALGAVRHLAATGASLSVTWDGTNDAGVKLPGGEYTIDVAAQGPGGRPGPGPRA